MAQDLRSFIDLVKRKGPGDYQVVGKALLVLFRLLGVGQ